MKQILCLACLASACSAFAAEPFELRDGDRVVLLGNTLIEREQQYGYWETALTLRFPDRNVTFRNLGWSGDTVWGEARAGFDTPKEGFQRLVEHTLAIKPTVIILGYGGNEAFGGEAQLPRFLQGLQALLDRLQPTHARIVLLAPPRQEGAGPSLSKSESRNRDSKLYRDAIHRIAQHHGFPFVDLFQLRAGDTQVRLTDNGIHFTPFGYWKSAAEVENNLFGDRPHGSRIELEIAVKTAAVGARVDMELDGPMLRFQATRARLPWPLPPRESPKTGTVAMGEAAVRVRGLSDGIYRLRIDGKPVATAAAAEWAAGITLSHGPDLEQVERLRETIVEKNRLYFYRWRPQNETYLFGFRKHEQGQNAPEVPLFDPLVAKKEAEIAQLRVPVVHRYELARVREGKP